MSHSPAEPMKGTAKADEAERPKGKRWHRQRSKILTIAGRLFLHKGYLGTSIADISKAADLNKAGIYHYFDNKAAILYEIAVGSTRGFLDLALPVANSELPPAKKLQALVTNHMKWQMSNSGITGLGAVERANLPPKLLRSYISLRDEYEAIYRNVIEECIRAGEIRPMDARLASLFTLGLMNSAMQWFKPQGKLSPEQVATEAWELLFQGLRANTTGPTQSANPTVSHQQPEVTAAAGADRAAART